MKDLTVTFKPVDDLNPRAGYQLRIEDTRRRETLLWTGCDPVSGRTLRNPADCMRVVAMYIPAEVAP